MPTSDQGTSPAAPVPVMRLLTLFPDMVRVALETSILGRAARQGLVPLRALAKLLEFSRAIEQREQPFGAPVGECEKILRHFSA